MRRGLMAVWMVGLAFGCVERAPELSPQDRERLAEYVTDEVPSPARSLDVAFEGVELLGYEVRPEAVAPGRPFVLTLYWHVTSAPGRGWELFTHGATGSGQDVLNADGPVDNENVANAVVRELYQPFRWQSGDYIRDQLQITVPPDWASETLVIYVGFWNRNDGGERLALTRGPSDGEDRARVVTIPVGGVRAAARPAAREPQVEVAAADPDDPRNEPPRLTRAERAPETIVVDGRLDDEGWLETRQTRDFVDPRNGRPGQPTTTAFFTWDDDNLYLGVNVHDTSLRSRFRARDEHLWEDDVVELMIDPNGDGEGYYELQVAPTGVTFETRYRQPRQPGPFGDVSWNPELEVAVDARGTINDDQEDNGYTLEMALPWSEIGGTPEANSLIHANVYVMDRPLGGGAPRAVAWSPVFVPDFHTLERFGRVRLRPPAAAPAEIVEVPAAERTPTNVQVAAGASVPGEVLQPSAVEVPGAAAPNARAAQEVRLRYRQPADRTRGYRVRTRGQ